MHSRNQGTRSTTHDARAPAMTFPTVRPRRSARLDRGACCLGAVRLQFRPPDPDHHVRFRRLFHPSGRRRSRRRIAAWAGDQPGRARGRAGQSRRRGDRRQHRAAPWLGVATALAVRHRRVVVRAAVARFAMAALVLVAAEPSSSNSACLHNAMLPTLVPRAMIGRMSGWAWDGLRGRPAAGLRLFDSSKPTPWFGVGTIEAANVRGDGRRRPGSRSSRCRSFCSRPTRPRDQAWRAAAPVTSWARSADRELSRPGFWSR